MRDRVAVDMSNEGGNGLPNSHLRMNWLQRYQIRHHFRGALKALALRGAVSNGAWDKVGKRTDNL